jgi:hypothetical protein
MKAVGIGVKLAPYRRKSMFDLECRYLLKSHFNPSPSREILENVHSMALLSKQLRFLQAFKSFGVRVCLAILDRV